MDKDEASSTAAAAEVSVESAVEGPWPEELPGRCGRYLLLRRLARGGMGQVFLGSTMGVEGAERPVVIKRIRQEYSHDENFLARFLDEARVQSQLQHSGVAQIIEAATHEPSGDPYVVIEYVEGKSLGAIRRRVAEVGHRLSWEDAVALGTLLLDGLTHTHERRDPRGRPLRIVHRDLSPHNVMVSYGGEVKIIDFGTARGQNRRCRTVAGVVFAKPGYVAPEVANGDSGDGRVDLYAAGVMIWELCAGRRFLQGEPAEHMAAVAKDECRLPPIASLVGAPRELDEVLAKLTAFDRAERYPATRTASAELARLLRSAPALPNGERGVRARVAQLMYHLYPDEPGRSRRQFARLVAQARERCEKEPAGLELVAEPEPSEPVDEAILPGTRYRLRRELGRGSSSVVYEAEHVDLGRRAAIKVLDAAHTHSREFAARFRREGRALSRAAHSGLVRVHDFGQSADGRLFCVMELLEGQTLRDALEQDEAFDWRRALRIIRQACLALDVAHRRGVVHRDVKPANLFLTRQGRVKLIDFGLAKTAEEVLEPGLEATAAEPHDEAELGALTFFGTPEYMAPEQVAGGLVDGRADLYALGCVLYELVTGRLPFVASHTVGLLDAKLRGHPEPPRVRAPARRIPRSVDRIAMRALARHPGRRFSTAAEMADAIVEALERPTRQRQRRRAIGSAVLTAAMAFGLVLVGQQVGPTLAERLPAELPWMSAQQEVRDGSDGRSPHDLRPANSQVSEQRGRATDGAPSGADSPPAPSPPMSPGSLEHSAPQGAELPAPRSERARPQQAAGPIEVQPVVVATRRDDRDGAAE